MWVGRFCSGRPAHDDGKMTINKMLLVGFENDGMYHPMNKATTKLS
jgi:hypothetical protein